MHYSIESRDRIYVKGYGFLSFAKNMGTHLSNKYSQTLFDSAQKSTVDALKTASKRAIHKKAEAAGDLIGNKIADKLQMHQNLQKSYIHKVIWIKQIYQKKYIYLKKKKKTIN